MPAAECSVNLVWAVFLADDTGHIVAAPVVPVPSGESDDVLIRKERQAVLGVPVVGFILAPVEEAHLLASALPGPVTIVVVAVRTLIFLER